MACRVPVDAPPSAAPGSPLHSCSVDPEDTPPQRRPPMEVTPPPPAPPRPLHSPAAVAPTHGDAAGLEGAAQTDEPRAIADRSFEKGFFLLAPLLWTAACAKRVPRLSWEENAQNLALLVALTAMGVLPRLRPRFYHRHSELLRVLLLAFAYSLPILSSSKLMQVIASEPSTHPTGKISLLEQPHWPPQAKFKLLRWVEDTFSLWLATRCAFLAWALIGCHPPLHLAVPLQLFALWRIRGAGFCKSPVLRHPIMIERTALAHLGMTLVSSGMGSSLQQAIVPAEREHRCAALLLFYLCLFGFLLPLLLLLPLRQQHSRLAAAQPSRRTLLGSTDARIEGWLSSLMWRRGDLGRVPQDPRMVVLRWWLLLVALWSACCLLESL